MATIIRIKNRVYETHYLVDTEGLSRSVQRVKHEAEYAVITGQKIHARLKRSNKKWVAIERSDETRFGLVVSPMNITSWRRLRKWALRRWGR